MCVCVCVVQLLCCYQGLEKALEFGMSLAGWLVCGCAGASMCCVVLCRVCAGWFDFRTFDIRQYEEFEKIEKGQQMNQRDFLPERDQRKRNGHISCPATIFGCCLVVCCVFRRHELVGDTHTAAGCRGPVPLFPPLSLCVCVCVWGVNP